MDDGPEQTSSITWYPCTIKNIYILIFFPHITITISPRHNEFATKKKKKLRSKQTKAIIHIDDQKVANQVHETPTIGEKRTKAIRREREREGKKKKGASKESTQNQI